MSILICERGLGVRITVSPPISTNSLCRESSRCPLARRLSAEVPRTTLLGVVAYHDGDWARAAELFSGGIESARRAGSRVREADCSYWLARALRATGDSRRSRELLAEALVWFGQGSLLTVEMWLRPEAALIHSALGELDRAEAEIRRCRQIVDGGEDWRGLRGNLLRAEAVFASSRGDPVRSSSLFAAAIEAFREYQLPWEEADVLELWGLALKSDGDRVAAAGKVRCGSRNLSAYRSQSTVARSRDGSSRCRGRR